MHVAERAGVTGPLWRAVAGDEAHRVRLTLPGRHRQYAVKGSASILNSSSGRQDRRPAPALRLVAVRLVGGRSQPELRLRLDPSYTIHLVLYGIQNRSRPQHWPERMRVRGKLPPPTLA